MSLLDLEVLPRIRVAPDELEAAVTRKQISKHARAQRQIIVRLEKLDSAMFVRAANPR